MPQRLNLHNALYCMKKFPRKKMVANNYPSLHCARDMMGTIPSSK
jgi:hypothetical protein